jgi:DNA polymerase III subunit delta'
MKFSEIAGQKEVINRIVQNVKIGRISHAQMIVGKEGSGSLSLALAFAQFVNCTNKQYAPENSELHGDSCGECPSCYKSKKLIHPDIHFVLPVNETKQIKKKLTKYFMPAWRDFIQSRSAYVGINQWYDFIEMEKQGIISADECNEILNTLNYKTYESEYKIMIIWMVEKLYYSAAPKILKILEEPPQKTLFLLVSDNPFSILDTIISRVQMIKLSKLSVNDIVKYLDLHYSTPQSTAVKLCDAYDCNLNAIIEALNHEDISAQFMKLFVEWMRICFKQNTSQILSLSNEFKEMGREKQKQYLQFAITQIRNAWVQKISTKLYHCHSSEHDSFYKNFGKYLHETNTQLIRKELELTYYAIERNANHKILFTDTSLKIGNLLKLQPN